MSDSEDPLGPTRTGAPAAPKRPRFWKQRRIWWLFAALLLFGCLAAGARGTQQYFTRDPSLCTSCHVDDQREVHRSVHKTIECAGCHKSQFGQNLQQWALGLVSNTDTTPHGVTDRSACKTCHTNGKLEPWQMASTKGHLEHVLNLETPLDCSKCHTWEEHATQPKPESCQTCHDQVQILDGHRLQNRAEKIGCLSCHNYLSNVSGGALTPSNDCQRCHGGTPQSDRSSRFDAIIPGKAVTHSMIHGNVKTCSLCHGPHRPPAEQRAKGLDCLRCHVKVSEEHHHRAEPDKFDCNTCHKVHGPRAELAQSCANCHEQAREPAATVAMQHQRCSTCHKAHAFVSTVEGCKGCHQEQTQVLASWQAGKHEDCSNCHKPHDTREETTVCVDCHQLGAHAHQACTTCHDPHQDKSHTKSCGACHKSQISEVSASVQAHRSPTCSTCHQRHVFGGASKACGACHQNQSVQVASAGNPKHTVCSSCHQPHGFTAQFRACTACHQTQSTGAHTGQCGNCHQTHGPPLGKAANCSTCHQDVPKPTGKHADCSSCHKAAHGPEIKPGPCSSCHRSQAAKVLAFSVETHRRCQECHQTHEPARPKTCNQCHSSQASSVQGSRHSCGSCHQTHEPKLSPCASCHATQASATRSRGKTHSDCAACHEPHKTVSAPSCGSCHRSLPAAHNKKGHDNCKDCHSAHARTMPARQPCLRCHTDRADHFPESNNCAGCHLFK